MWGCVRYVLDLPLIYHLQGLDVLELSGDSSISIRDENTVQMFSSLLPSIHSHTVFTTSGLPKEPSSLKKGAEQKPFLADFREDRVRFIKYSTSVTRFNKKKKKHFILICVYIWDLINHWQKHMTKNFGLSFYTEKKWWLSQWFSIHMRMFISGH